MKVNEIFYSLQGEGHFTGTPAIFIRLSGCNLHCPFCDTLHSTGRHMSEDEIAQAAAQWEARHVVLTGGEPALHATQLLIDRLHACGKLVAIETNGTHALPKDIDWVTLSPKDSFVENATPVLKECDELKVVFTGAQPNEYAHIRATLRYLQPCDTGNATENQRLLKAAIDYCKSHPQWRLSLQTHKLIGIR